MHELGVVFKIIDDLEEVAQENDLKKISTVTLSLGEVSTVIPEYLKDPFFVLPISSNLLSIPV